MSRLHWAAKEGNLEEVRNQIALGFDVNVRLLPPMPRCAGRQLIIFGFFFISNEFILMVLRAGSGLCK